MAEHDWYSNKDLHGMILQQNKEFHESLAGLTKHMDGLAGELEITRREIKVYNNLRSTLNQTMSDLNDLKIDFANSQNKAAGRQSVANGIVKWSGWAIGIIGILSKALGWW